MNQKNIFRKKALEQLSSPEQLDLLVKNVSTQSWLYLLSFGMIILGTIVWGIFGSVSTKVHGNGIIMHTNGIQKIYANTQGVIENINVKNLDYVKVGDVIATLSHGALREELTAQQKAMEEMLKDFKILKSNTANDKQLALKNRANMQREVDNTLSLQNKKLNNLSHKLKAQKTLYTKGLITKQAYIQTEETILKEKNVITELKNSIKLTKETFIQSNQTQDKQIDTLKDTIEEKKLKILALKHKLLYSNQILSTEEGQIFDIEISKGSIIHVGSSIVGIQKNAQLNKLEAVFFVPAIDGKMIEKSFLANISPSTIKKEEYGFIRAKVFSVGTYPASKLAVMNILQNPELTLFFTKDGPPIIVKVKLQENKKNYSKLEWSSVSGPQAHITGGTLCSAEVTVKKQAPITLVIPLLKKTFGLEDE